MANLNDISYNVLKSLTSCKWFYESTIRDAIEHELYQRNISITDEEKDQVVSKIKDALEVIKKEE